MMSRGQTQTARRVGRSLNAIVLTVLLLLFGGDLTAPRPVTLLALLSIPTDSRTSEAEESPDDPPPTTAGRHRVRARSVGRVAVRLPFSTASLPVSVGVPAAGGSVHPHPSVAVQHPPLRC